MPELPEPPSKEVQEFLALIEDAQTTAETEWKHAWDAWERDAAALNGENWNLLLSLASNPALLGVPAYAATKAYLQISKTVDLFTTLFSSISQIPLRVAVKVTILRFPLPKEWHQKAIPLDDGIRLGITILTTAFLDLLSSPTLPLEMAIKRYAGAVKLTKLLRSMPDFDPIEAAGIIRSKLLQFVLTFVGAVITFGMLIGLLLALTVLAFRLNDKAQAGRIVSFALPQDSKRIYSTQKNHRHRINQQKGPDQ